MKPSTFLTISFYVKFLVDTSDNFYKKCENEVFKDYIR